MGDPQDDIEKYNEQYIRGEISYDQLVKRGNEALERLEKQCGHKHTTSETTSKGGQIVWCDDCGAKVSVTSGGSLATAGQKSGGGNCAVVALSLISAAGALGWGLIEAISAIFG